MEQISSFSSYFGTEIEEDCIKIILEKGELTETNVTGHREGTYSLLYLKAR